VFLLEAHHIPRALQRELVLALASDPARRHPDAGTLAQALRRALADEPGPPAPAPAFAAATGAPPAGRGGRAKARRALLGAGVLLSVTLVIANGTRPASRPAPGPQPTPAPAGPLVPVEVDTLSPPASSSAGPPPPEADTPAPALPRAVLGADGQAPFALELDGADGSVRVPLPAPAVVVLPLADGRVAVGTAQGEVLLVDPNQPAPALLHAFAQEVLGLELLDGRLVARGDDRRPRRLGEGEVATPDELEVEGTLGRWAFPRHAPPAQVALELPPP
jgi:hypothetical protein